MESSVPQQPAYDDISYQSRGSQMPQYIEWILASPSLPTGMRDQFFMMWEMAALGNYEGTDIAVLMAKFDEWRIHWIMEIPDKYWGKILVYRDTPSAEKTVQMDINTIMDMLWSLYFIQLTRGRNAETLRSLNSQWIHSDQKQELLESRRQKKGLRLF